LDLNVKQEALVNFWCEICNISNNQVKCKECGVLASLIICSKCTFHNKKNDKKCQICKEILVEENYIHLTLKGSLTEFNDSVIKALHNKLWVGNNIVKQAPALGLCIFLLM
jgi:hypothetical protein